MDETSVHFDLSRAHLQRLSIVNISPSVYGSLLIVFLIKFYGNIWAYWQIATFNVKVNAHYFQMLGIECTLFNALSSLFIQKL